MGLSSRARFRHTGRAVLYTVGRRLALSSAGYFYAPRALHAPHLGRPPQRGRHATEGGADARF